MRRKKNEITDPAEIEAVIKNSQVCRLAMSNESGPYIVPLFFGHRGNALFFHCARKGKKLDMIQNNPRVCFEMTSEMEIVANDLACDWTARFRSVIGFGTARVILDGDEKKAAFEAIMDHYDAPRPHKYSDSGMKASAIIRVDIESMTGKRLPAEPGGDD